MTPSSSWSSKPFRCLLACLLSFLAPSTVWNWHREVYHAQQHLKGSKVPSQHICWPTRTCDWLTVLCYRQQKWRGLESGGDNAHIACTVQCIVHFTWWSLPWTLYTSLHTLHTIAVSELSSSYLLQKSYTSSPRNDSSTSDSQSELLELLWSCSTRCGDRLSFLWEAETGLLSPLVEVEGLETDVMAVRVESGALEEVFVDSLPFLAARPWGHVFLRRRERFFVPDIVGQAVKEARKTTTTRTVFLVRLRDVINTMTTERNPARDWSTAGTSKTLASVLGSAVLVGRILWHTNALHS